MMFTNIRRRKILAAALTGAVLAALAVAAGASAGRTEHGTFAAHDHFVDTETCAFPIVGDFDYTNDNTAVFDDQGQIKNLLLHQRNVGTLVGNGVTLRENDRWNVQVDWLAGEPVTSKHVGITLHLIGPHGTIVRGAGQIVFEVVNGFDGPIIAVHGPALDGDTFTQAQFCAAFS
jgi:hypothetical protein